MIDQRTFHKYPKNIPETLISGEFYIVEIKVKFNICFIKLDLIYGKFFIIIISLKTFQ